MPLITYKLGIYYLRFQSIAFQLLRSCPHVIYFLLYSKPYTTCLCIAQNARHVYCKLLEYRQ